MQHLWYYALVINAAGFLLMHIDKKNALKKRRRIPEAMLLGSALIGGSIGAMLGMYLFRHKTKHPVFSLGLPVISALHLLLIIFPGGSFQ